VSFNSESTREPLQSRELGTQAFTGTCTLTAWMSRATSEEAPALTLQRAGLGPLARAQLSAEQLETVITDIQFDPRKARTRCNSACSSVCQGGMSCSFQLSACVHLCRHQSSIKVGIHVPRWTRGASSCAWTRKCLTATTSPNACVLPSCAVLQHCSCKVADGVLLAAVSLRCLALHLQWTCQAARPSPPMMSHLFLHDAIPLSMLQAVVNGAAAFIAMRPLEHGEEHPLPEGFPVLIVEKTLTELGRLAAAFCDK